MKKFIIMFIACIFMLALAIGQCDTDSMEMVDDDFNEEQSVKCDVQKLGIRADIGNLEDKSPDELVNDTSVEFVNDSSVEIPGPISDAPEQIIKRKAYIVSYNKKTKCPNWVAWYLSSSHVDGDWARSNDYREDFDVPAPRATNEDYRGSSWSRGHMCPAGDCRWDAKAMSETFLLSNMCPQDINLNSGLWNRIETDCRRWAKRYGGVYIVCGPLYYNSKHEIIGSNRVVVPEAFFKVILCLQGKPKAIGFVVKNNDGARKKDQYVNSVDEVERITGIDFFPNLPDELETIVEATANIHDW
jgi:endonuclease G